MGNILSYTVKPFDGTSPKEKGEFVEPLIEELEDLYGYLCDSDEWIDHQRKKQQILDLLEAYHIQVVDECGDPMNMLDSNSNLT